MAGFTVNYNNNTPNTALNDLYLDSNGNLAFITDFTTEVVETGVHATNLWRGENQFNTLQGVDYNSYLSSNEPQGNNIQTDLIRNLNQVNGVQKIQQIVFTDDRSSRTLAISVVCELTNGTVQNITIGS